MGFTHDHMVSFMSFLEDTLIFPFGINNIDIMKYYTPVPQQICLLRLTQCDHGSD